MKNPLTRIQLGARLLEERQRLGLSQQGMANAMGGTRISVCFYENGKTSPSAESLIAMEAIGVDIRYVLTGMRHSPSTVDRQRFKAALTEVSRQAKASGEKLALDTAVDLAWEKYEAHVDTPVQTGHAGKRSA